LYHHYDIQAGSFEIKDSKIIIDESDKYPTLFGDTICDFFESTPYDRGYPVRIGILILYDARKLELAPKIDPRAPSHRLEKYLYKFKDRENKPDALLGVVRILR